MATELEYPIINYFDEPPGGAQAIGGFLNKIFTSIPTIMIHNNMALILARVNDISDKFVSLPINFNTTLGGVLKSPFISMVGGMALTGVKVDGVEDLSTFTFYGDDGANNFTGGVFSLPLSQTVEISVFMGGGNDVGSNGYAAGKIDGGDGDDKLYGYGGNDILIGGSGNDELYGGADSDRLYAGSGVDKLDGGDGNDTYVLNGDTNDTITDSSGTDTIRSTISRSLVSGIENLFLEGVENINGSGNSANNTIHGNGGNNTLNGGSGNDQLFGLHGNDVLIGGKGVDTLFGDLGSDAFLFNAALDPANADNIMDFAADDTIRLENSIFTAILGTGILTSSQFCVTPDGRAVDADDRIIVLEGGPGSMLFYDADGSGAGEAVRFAYLHNYFDLSHADFVVV